MALVPELGNGGFVQSVTEKGFNSIPTHLVSFFGSIYGGYFRTRFLGRRYEDRVREIRVLETKTGKEIQDFENRRLRAMIRHCYDSVPYYRRMFRRLGIASDDIVGREDLSKIPVLTRDEVARNSSDLVSVSPEMSGSRWVGTSGTTGTPLRILWDREVQAVEYAYVHAQWRWSGFSLKNRRVTLRGNIIVPQARNKPPFWIHNVAENQLLMSVFHLRPNTIRHYARALEDFRPTAIQAYPSALYILAVLIDEAGLKAHIPLAFTASEPLYEHYRSRIESVLGCRVFDMYGQTERVGMAAQCEEWHYHELPGYGILETVDDLGQQVSGGSGKVIGTGLNNWLMPLLRYDTGDVARFSDEDCSCGRNFKTIGKVFTKSEDILVLPDGSLVSPSVLTHPFKNVKGILRSQIVQEKPELVSVKLMTNEDFSAQDGDKILSELSRRLGSAVCVELHLVDDIPHAGRGKFRWIISKVAKEKVG
jgi:phenylacetate-CoA ligase